MALNFRSKPFEEYVNLGETRNGKVVEMPAPFEDMARFPDRVAVDGAGGGGVAVKPAMTKAFLLLAGHMSVKTAVTYTDPISDEVYVEYAEDDTRDVVFRFNPNVVGPTMWGFVNDSYLGPQQYELHANTPQDATALWLGVITAALRIHPENYLLQDRLDDLKNYLALQHLDAAWESMARCQYFVYEVMTGKGSNNRSVMSGATWANNQTACATLGLEDVRLADDGILNEICGHPSLLTGIKSSTTTMDVFTPNNPKEVAKLHKFLTRKVSDYAPWEKAMIPPLNDRYEETQVDVDLVKTIERTWKKAQDMQVKNFAFFGPAGSGKSAAEEHLAALLKMPFSRQMCSSGDDETSLFGTIIPVVDGMKTNLSGEAKAIAEVLEASGDKIDLEKVADAIGFPSPEMCMFDKDAALEIMGIEDSGEPIMDQRRKALEKKILKVTENNKGNDGITYKYIPSPLVTGIENGHIVALEEPTNVFNQGIFSCLYDVLDRNSTGTIRTPIGVITRHPDFVCMLSSNTSYTGNRDLPGPLKSRFQYLAHFKEPDVDSLAKRVMKKIGAAQDKFATILDCVKAYKAGNERARDLGQSADYEATPRALFCFTDAVLDEVDPQKAYQAYVLPHLANEDEDIRAIWNGVKESNIFTRR